jgi:transcriptional regulator
MELYLPKHFAGKDWERLVREFPLATVVSGGHVSLLPLLLEQRGKEHWLLGHLARANPHWRELDGRTVTALFHGPQAYISPLWYEECDVPTWNYALVHLEGTARLLPDPRESVEKLSARMEGEDGWRFQVPADLQGRLEQAIVAFEIRVEKAEAKYKLNQNRSREDQEGVIRGLRQRGSASDLAVAGFMEEILS